MSRFRKLLVPLDFSEHSEHALDIAVEMAASLGAQVHLVHAYELPVGPAMAYGIAFPEEVTEKVRDAAARRLSKAWQEVEGAGLEGETHLVPGTPAEAIAATAERISADLVVMGTRGLSGLKHVLLGSVAERVLRLARCPVLTVKRTTR